MICHKCGYEWKSRAVSPKACPRCKTRLDFYIKKTEAVNDAL